MAQSVIFEMYVRTNNTWQQYERFIELERDDALATARQMDLEPDVEGVRIIRVTSFSSKRAPLETLEWISPSLRRDARRAKATGRKSTAAPGTTETGLTSEAARELNQRKSGSASGGQQRSAGRVALAATGIVAGASALAAAVFVPTRFLLQQLNDPDLDEPPLYQEIAAFSVSAIVFIILAGIGFYLVLRSDLFHKQRPRAAAKAPRPRPSATGKPKPRPEQSAKSATVPEPPEPATDPGPPAEMALLFAPSLDDDDREPDFDGEPDTADAEAQSAPPVIATGLKEEYRISMLRFLEGSLSELADILKTIDTYSLFGINLFLGGAGDRFAVVHSLGGIQRYILIRETISALGTQIDMVDLFCEKFDAYDRDPNYRFMTEAGRQILDKYLASEPRCFATLPDLIKRWRRSNAATAQAQGIIVIMFTDLVGSTQMTHDHGDLGAQQVVRAHNVIVRNALAQFHGEEVKHTGDGIMASFSNAPNSLRAAIAIQRQISAHNTHHPDLPVRVRIGLNAGDAVREEDDFFGQTVQLAARICDKAGENEIFVTPSVHDLCQTHAFKFTSAGAYALKGIDQPVTAYAVDWQHPKTLTDAGSS
ncbi:MAG: hypothetical protein HQ483_01200 [Rhodospirillales bacterium]|nr:hypothetical protein [Rhodospirillales bacterium]